MPPPGGREHVGSGRRGRQRYGPEGVAVCASVQTASKASKVRPNKRMLDTGTPKVWGAKFQLLKRKDQEDGSVVRGILCRDYVQYGHQNQRTQSLLLAHATVLPIGILAK